MSAEEGLTEPGQVFTIERAGRIGECGVPAVKYNCNIVGFGVEAVAKNKQGTGKIQGPA
jgi:hypothetical protein